MTETSSLDAQQWQSRLQNLVTQWSQGKTSLKSIMGLSEEEMHAVASQAYFLFLQGKVEAARVIFEGLVAIDPRNAYYYRALGTIYWRLKDPIKALKQLTYAIRVSPTDVSAYINRAEIYIATQQFPQARLDLAAALQHAKPTDVPLVKKAHAMVQIITGGVEIALPGTEPRA